MATSNTTPNDSSANQAPSAIRPGLEALLPLRDAGEQLYRILSLNTHPDEIATDDGYAQWDQCGSKLFERGRYHEARALFLKLYELRLEAQRTHGRLHKGGPLIWISECYGKLGCPVHAKRYAMLALCEDAVTRNGAISPDDGAYFQLVWKGGLQDEELRANATTIFKAYNEAGALGNYPEALLQRLDHGWMREIATDNELFHYVIHKDYFQYLLDAADRQDDLALESLAEYAISSIAGVRVSKRKESLSTEYDLVCSLERIQTDFRSEWGQYFVCECKNSKDPVDFSAFAKFCRVLDSVKARFGILFSRAGISDAAKHEQSKIYQDRGIVIIVLDRDDLKAMQKGRNVVTLLRERYERIRLDLKQ